MPTLTWYHPDHDTHIRHRIGPGRSIVGRSDACDIIVPDDDGVSRRHCTVEGRQGEWWVVDRSRHGTYINGVPVDRKTRLDDGDELTLGRTRLVFHDEDAPAETTTEAIVTPPTHEEVLHGDGAVAIAVAALRFTDGPLAGTTRILRKSRTSLGGVGAEIVLDPDLPPRAIIVHVVRSRVMIQTGPTIGLRVAGGAARTMMPVYEGEEVRLGDHAFVVETHVEDQAQQKDVFGEMVGRTKAMRDLFGMLARMAGHPHPVLLLGESGTGKELAARALHTSGPRAGGAFEAINCAALPHDLVESTLFGHEKGAFTGAEKRQDGAFQRADGGTLFLDEVGELALDAQAKLLRALESGEVRRVGGASSTFPDVRVVAATHRDLREMVAHGTFREDLLYRLSVLTLRMPPLRERREDIPLLAETLVERLLPGGRLTPGALDALREHDWPGNVRELRNVLTRAFVMGGPVIERSSLVFSDGVFPESPQLVMEPAGPTDERTLIRQALKRSGGNRTAAARELGMPRSSLLYKMSRLGIR